MPCWAIAAALRALVSERAASWTGAGRRRPRGRPRPSGGPEGKAFVNLQAIAADVQRGQGGQRQGPGARSEEADEAEKTKTLQDPTSRSSSPAAR